MLYKDLYIRAFKNLKKNKYRYILIILSICISTLSLIFMRSIGYNIKNDLINAFNNNLNLQEIEVVYNGTNEELIENINLRIDDVKKINGLKDVVYENYIMKISIENENEIDNIINQLNSKEYAVFSNYDELKNIIKILDLINIILMILGSIALFIGIINISNAISVSINDRKYEIGVMRALGIKFKDLKNLFFLENLIVTVSAVTIGIIVKILVSPMIDSIFQKNIPFSFSNVESITKIPLLELIKIISFILILVVFTIWISLKKLKKIDIAQIVKGD